MRQQAVYPLGTQSPSMPVTSRQKGHTAHGAAEHRTARHVKTAVGGFGDAGAGTDSGLSPAAVGGRSGGAGGAGEVGAPGAAGGARRLPKRLREPAAGGAHGRDRDGPTAAGAGPSGALHEPRAAPVLPSEPRSRRAVAPAVPAWAGLG